MPPSGVNDFKPLNLRVETERNAKNVKNTIYFVQEEPNRTRNSEYNTHMKRPNNEEINENVDNIDVTEINQCS